MTPTDFAASSAIGLSVMAMMACIVTLPMVYQRGASIQVELYDDMSEFKVITDGAWDDVMAMRGVPSLRKGRQANDYGHCHCYDRKSRRSLNLSKTSNRCRFQKILAHQDRQDHLANQVSMANTVPMERRAKPGHQDPFHHGSTLPLPDHA